MPETEIVKLKIRRGLDSQRSSVVLEQGELGYATDTRRVWVGDGVTDGGVIIGNNNYITTNKLNLITATKGDIVYENNLLYQLKADDSTNASNWQFIGTSLDSNVLEYDNQNKLTIKTGGVGRESLAGDIASNTGGLIYSTGAGMSIDVDNTTTTIINNKLKVKEIDAQNIKSTALGDGLTGGSGTSLKLKIDTNQFKFTSGNLAVKAGDGITSDVNGVKVNIDTNHFDFSAGKLTLRAGNGIDLGGGGVTIKVNTDQFSFDSLDQLNLRSDLNGLLDISSIDSDGFGNGLTYNGSQLVADLADTDNTLLVTDNTVGLNTVHESISASKAFTGVVFDEYGRFTDFEPLAEQLIGTVGSGAPYLSSFVGSIDETDPTDRSLVECIDGDSQTVTLTSAGFMRMQTTIDGQVRTIAIPVFV